MFSGFSFWTTLISVESADVMLVTGAIKKYGAFPFGLGIGYGVGVAYARFMKTTWNGMSVSSEVTAESWDLIVPVEIVFAPGDNIQISVGYTSSVLKLVSGTVVFNYSHVISLNIGYNINLIP
ncbi:MAG: hypothetical protein JXD23_05630 [Spirochaetales bacterium]|nr:hypothetical protein [Spirochaetales bacterium]